MLRTKPSWRTALVALIAGAAGLTALGLIGSFWLRHSAAPFLPAIPGADWIVYPRPIESTTQAAISLGATFQRSFTLERSPARATVEGCAFGEFQILVNGQPALTTTSPAGNWKSPVTAEITRLLGPGTNVITAWVTNSVGPPALWLRLEAGSQAIATDESWQATLAGSDWQNARLANRPPATSPDNPLLESESTLDSLKRAWPFLTVLSAVVLGMVLCFRTLTSKPEPRFRTWIFGNGIWLLLAVVLTARVALFVHNAPLLPRMAGFDAPAHEQYVQFILDHHALPLPSDGWEMYQPPLYYSAGALVLGTLGYTLPSDEATFALRTLNGVVGLVHCWLVLLCLRLLFPGNLSAQAAGLLVAAFLPPHLYLSQFVTNEPLAGMFVTAALYFYLRTQHADRFALYVGLGAALGAAMLTKISALIPVVVLAIALVLRLLRPKVAGLVTGAGQRAAEGQDRRPRARHHEAPAIKRPNNPTIHRSTPSILYPLSSALAFLLICGWHFVRIWAHTGRPLVGNWDSDSPFAWWQDPGFRTSAFYTHFGQALVRPLFSGIYGFADGFYSTLWGDGLAGGAARLESRRPWDYDLMNSGYLLSLVLCLVLLVGLCAAIHRAVREGRQHSGQPAPFPFPKALTVLLFLFALAVLYMSLRVPSYAQVKAFYAFPCLLPFAALFALGWSRLVEGAGPQLPRLQVFRGFKLLVLSCLLFLWSFLSVATFWVRPNDPETYLLRGLYFAEDQHPQDAEALASLTQALELDAAALGASHKALLPASRAEAHRKLGAVLERQGRAADAVVEYRRALSVRPDFPGAMNNLAWLLATTPNDTLRDGPEAARLAERACALTHHELTVYIGTLAAALASAGRFPEAVATATRACECARLRHEADLVERNRQLLELYRAGKAYVEK